MPQGFDKRLSAICAAGGDLLYGGLKGVEKESLRVAADGTLARTPHPKALGSALTNKYITTDFSEALLEFVTPAFSTTWEALHCICDIHQFTYANLGDEMLWASSMPCVIPDDENIPLARYGTSNVGQTANGVANSNRAMSTIGRLTTKSSSCTTPRSLRKLECIRYPSEASFRRWRRKFRSGAR